MVLPILFFSLVLNGCALFDIFGKKDIPKASPEGLYAKAANEYKEGNYKKAQEYFLRVKEQYPLHELAVLAEIGVADAQYSDKEYA